MLMGQMIGEQLFDPDDSNWSSYTNPNMHMVFPFPPAMMESLKQHVAPTLSMSGGAPPPRGTEMDSLRTPAGDQVQPEPGEWIKYAREKPAGSSKWGTLKAVLRLSWCVGRGSLAPMSLSEDEQREQRERLQEEVDWYKQKLCLMQESWADINQDEMDWADVSAFADPPANPGAGTAANAGVPVPGEKRPHPEPGPRNEVHTGPGDICRGPFQARSIACAQCKIWQQLEQQPHCQSILDVDGFCAELAQLLPLSHAPVHNEWVIFSVQQDKKKCTVFLTMRGVWGPTVSVCVCACVMCMCVYV